MSRFDKIKELHKVAKSQIAQVPQALAVGARHTAKSGVQEGSSELSGELAQIIAGTVYGGLTEWVTSIGGYESFEAWIKVGIPDFAKGEAKVKFFKMLGFEFSASIAAALAIPALASWNFGRLGSPKGRMKYLYKMKNRGRPDGRREPLSISDNIFQTERESVLDVVMNTGKAQEVSRITGTNTPIYAYFLLLLSTQDMGELVGLRQAKIVDDSITTFVARAASAVRSNIKKDMQKKLPPLEELRKAVLKSGVFKDTPTKPFV
jgi:hypothetical protein